MIWKTPKMLFSNEARYKQANKHTYILFIRSFIYSYIHSNKCNAIEGDQSTPLKNTTLWHKDYWELKAREKKQTWRALYPSLSAYKAGHKSPLWRCSLLPYQKENNLYHWRDGTEMSLHKQTLLNKIILIYL